MSRPDALRPSPIVPTVDFDRDGVQHGCLRLPYSRDDSAWGSIMIPMTVVKRGEGPTALLTGGNHGDEYEGPIALFELARVLTTAEVTGRVIIVPAMNYPAFRAGTRTSPIDGGNLNRSSPGRPDGTPTEKIADFFQRHLLPMADVVVDLHSGGRTLAFVPFAATHARADADQERRSLAAVAAFGAPYSIRMREIDSVGMYDTAAEELGRVFVTTELGGGGSATAHTVGLARRGIRSVLGHAGILSGPIDRPPTVQLDMPTDACFVFSESDGLIEPCVGLGEAVRRGEVLARVYGTDRTGLAPAAYTAGLDGILIGRYFPGLVKRGDCLAVIGVPARS